MSGPPTPGGPGVRGIYNGLGHRGKPATSPQTSPLYFAGHLNGAADVPRLQAEVGVKVFIGGNGCGVCGAGCLLHRSLRGPQD